nr:bifunctional inhibitor/plant lipid transfer protein/seed storage helical domain-containing protein [Tanacetum cinerariifolium]
PVSAPTPSSASEAPGSTAAGPLPDRGAALSPAAPGNGGSNGASSNAVHNLSTIIYLAVSIFIAYYFYFDSLDHFTICISSSTFFALYHM